MRNVIDTKQFLSIKQATKIEKGEIECQPNEFQRYYRRYVRYAPQKKCDINCRKQKLCAVVTSNSKDITPKSIECKEVERIIDQSRSTKSKKVRLKTLNLKYKTSRPELGI